MNKQNTISKKLKRNHPSSNSLPFKIRKIDENELLLESQVIPKSFSCDLYKDPYQDFKKSAVSKFSLMNLVTFPCQVHVENNQILSNPNVLNSEDVENLQSNTINPFQLVKQRLEKRSFETKIEIFNEDMSDNNNINPNLNELYPMQFNLLNEYLNIPTSENKTTTDLKNNLTGNEKLMEKCYNKSLICLKK